MKALLAQKTPPPFLPSTPPPVSSFSNLNPLEQKHCCLKSAFSGAYFSRLPLTQDWLPFILGARAPRTPLPTHLHSSSPPPSPLHFLTLYNPTFQSLFFFCCFFPPTLLVLQSCDSCRRFQCQFRIADCLAVKTLAVQKSTVSV